MGKRWKGHVARMVETRNAYIMLARKSDGIGSTYTYNGGERRT
jgi:hypothetical protein